MATRVLVPLDTSPIAERALPVARAFARLLRAPITLVSVVECPYELGVWLARRDDSRVSELEVAISERERYLEGVKTKLRDIEASTLVRCGDASAEIVALAASFEPAIIVMASHGVTGFRQQVAGTVTTRIIHEACCPVVVVRADTNAAAPDVEPPISKVLAALDGSEFAEDALEIALDLLLPHKPDVHLIRVAELSRWFNIGYDGVGYHDGITSYVDAVHQEASRYLNERADLLSRDGYRVTTEVSEGSAERAITDAARDQKVDLLVLGTHGRSGLGRVIIGSVAQRILHNSPVPILMVHPRASSRSSVVPGAPAAAIQTGR